ncbi:ornithine cyclodeaminase family protein [Planotetraspora sp. GP83]|uniref:ornithine cyclodeaminase family protein n=1 Tax=Planotetraspora sp. GP83 TaxID=3156264 RepID=UPI003518AF1C
MSLPMPGHDGTEILFLNRHEVEDACRGMDLPAVVGRALVRHTRGETTLPEEAYLPWTAPDGAPARCLAMPGALRDDEDGWTYGIKIINGCLSNPSRGLARAQGVIMLFDPQTARPVALLEAAYISAMRTAAVTAVTAARLGVPRLARVAVLGCGTLARAHLRLLPAVLPDLREVRLFDLDPSACRRLADDLRAGHPDLKVVEAAGPRECVAGAQLVVPVTTTTSGYIAFDWLAPGALIAHVSLDDLLPEVVRRADLVLVDDWGLVAADSRRLLGRMYRSGELLAPDGARFHDAQAKAGIRRVDGHLGEVLAGVHPGRRSAEDIVVSNPFGMALLDVAVAHEVVSAASGALGRPLTL